MPGNLLPTVEVNSPPRALDSCNDLVDGRLPLRHFSSVDNFVTPPTRNEKMPRKPSLIRLKSRQVTVTPEEFNSLPPLIQMKYFSPGERLRIAKEAARQARKKQPSQSSSLHFRPSTDSVRRPKTGVRPDTDGTSTIVTRPQSAHARYPSAGSSAATTRSSTEAQPARPGFPTKACWRVRLNSTGSRSTGSQPVTDEEMGKSWLDVDATSVYSVESSGTVEGIFNPYGHKQQIPTNAMSTTLPPYPSTRLTPSPTPTAEFPPVRRRRVIKLTPLRLPPPTLLPAVPALPSPTTLRHMTRSIRSNSNNSASSAPSFATHDEECHHNPEKFDEAVDFGYTLDRPDCRAVSPLSNTGTSDSVPLAHDCEGEPADDEDDEDEASSAITPRAPSISSNGREVSNFQYDSVDSEFALPILSKLPDGTASVRSLSPDVVHHDTAVHITFAKPELRAPERELYSYQRKQVSGVEIDDDGALALQDLYVCDDHSGAQGAFAVCPSSKNGAIRKVWKNITRR